MVLSDEWINAHLGGTTPRLTAAHMVPVEPPSGRADRSRYTNERAVVRGATVRSLRRVRSHLTRRDGAVKPLVITLKV